MKILLQKNSEIKKLFKLKSKEVKDKNEIAEERIFEDRKKASEAIIKTSKKKYTKTKTKLALKWYTRIAGAVLLISAYKGGQFNLILELIMQAIENPSIIEASLCPTIEKTLLQMIKDGTTSKLFFATLAGIGANVFYSKLLSNKMRKDAMKVDLQITYEDLSKRDVARLEYFAQKRGAAVGLAPYVYLSKMLSEKKLRSSIISPVKRDLNDSEIDLFATLYEDNIRKNEEKLNDMPVNQVNADEEIENKQQINDETIRQDAEDVAIVEDIEIGQSEEDAIMVDVEKDFVRNKTSEDEMAK